MFFFNRATQRETMGVICSFAKYSFLILAHSVTVVVVKHCCACKLKVHLMLYIWEMTYPQNGL